MIRINSIARAEAPGAAVKMHPAGQKTVFGAFTAMTAAAMVCSTSSSNGSALDVIQLSEHPAFEVLRDSKSSKGLPRFSGVEQDSLSVQGSSVGGGGAPKKKKKGFLRFFSRSKKPAAAGASASPTASGVSSGASDRRRGAVTSLSEPGRELVTFFSNCVSGKASNLALDYTLRPEELRAVLTNIPACSHLKEGLGTESLRVTFFRRGAEDGGPAVFLACLSSDSGFQEREFAVSRGLVLLNVIQRLTGWMAAEGLPPLVILPEFSPAAAEGVHFAVGEAHKKFVRTALQRRHGDSIILEGGFGDDGVRYYAGALVAERRLQEALRADRFPDDYAGQAGQDELLRLMGALVKSASDDDNHDLHEAYVPKEMRTFDDLLPRDEVDAEIFELSRSALANNYLLLFLQAQDLYDARFKLYPTAALKTPATLATLATLRKKHPQTIFLVPTAGSQTPIPLKLAGHVNGRKLLALRYSIEPADAERCAALLAPEAAL